MNAIASVNVSKHQQTLSSNSEFPLCNPGLSKKLVVIDRGISHPEQLASGVEPNATALVLKPLVDPIFQITTALGRGQYHSLHIVAHGKPGSLYLAGQSFNSESLNPYRQAFMEWGVAEVWLYSCELALKPDFLESLHQLTGAAIAASTQTLGQGHWTLNWHLGAIASKDPFTFELKEQYSGLLEDLTEPGVIIAPADKNTQVEKDNPTSPQDKAQEADKEADQAKEDKEADQAKEDKEADQAKEDKPTPPNDDAPIGDDGQPKGDGGGPKDENPCFLPGTHILTDQGEVKIEDLNIGDRIQTADGTLEPIKWIGYQTCQPHNIKRPLRGYPICVKEGALGNGLPHRDLYLSPDHALLFEGLLINAGALVNGTSIVQTTPTQEFVYYHVELQKHALLVAEGSAAESYLPQTDDRFVYDNGTEYDNLYPHGNRIILWPLDYPRVSSYTSVPRFVRKKLNAIAAQLGLGEKAS